MTDTARASPGRDLAHLTGILAALVVVLSVHLSLPPGVRNWDNQVKLQVATNILRGIGPVLTEPTPNDKYYVTEGRDGKRYADYPPLAYVLQLLTIGFAGADGRLTEGIPALALLGLLAWMLVAWGMRSGAAAPAAAAGAMLVCLGTALWPMTARGDDNAIEAVALAAILWAGTGEEQPRSWLWAGVAMGAAVATRLGSVPLMVPALVLWIAQSPRAARSFMRRGLWFVAGATPGGVLVLWYNYVRFGSPFIDVAAKPSHHVLTTVAGAGDLGVFVPWFSRYHWEAIAGLTVSPGKGLLWYNPPLLGVVVFAVPLMRSQRAIFTALGAYALAGLMFFGRLTFWHSDWGWGPRYVAPLCVAATPLVWWLWQRTAQRGRLAHIMAAAGMFFLMTLQAIPVTGYPVETYFTSTLRGLESSGRLVTRPITQPPVPADNRTLYFHLETSPILSLGRSFSTKLRDPARAPAYGMALARALLAPTAALAFVGLVAMVERRRRPPARRPSRH